MSDPGGPDRIVAPDGSPDDLAEVGLRPQGLDDFVGQSAEKANLRIYIEAARGRGEALDHVLFHGPPGLGKTTLAQIVARELGVSFRATSGPVIAKAGDLAAILTHLQARDVLFIDDEVITGFGRTAEREEEIDDVVRNLQVGQRGLSAKLKGTEERPTVLFVCRFGSEFGHNFVRIQENSSELSRNSKICGILKIF